MFFEAAGAIMRAAWQALSSINFPGTGISLAAIMIGSFLAVLSLKLITLMMSHVNFGRTSQGAVRVSRKISRGDK